MKTVLDQLGINNGGTRGINRRDFLKISGTAGAGLMLAFNMLDAKAASTTGESFEPNAYLKIGTDGQIILMSKNPEIGQGVKTSMPQIIAEELEVEWTQIEVQQAPLDARLGAQFAGGSTAIKTNFDTLRRAGATAREMLIDAASRRWNISQDQCYASMGSVIRKDTKAQLTYAQLADAASTLEVNPDPPLKPRAEFKIIGRPIAGVDNKAIVTGNATFGLDARKKGMVVAVVERCPVFGGRVKSYDTSETLKVEGVMEVIKLDATDHPTQMVAGVAVVAKNTWSAIKGRKALKIEWDLSGGEMESDANLKTQFQKNIASQSDPIRDDGNIEQAFAQCDKIHEAVFEVPFLAHVTMEPMNYTADVREDSVELCGPTQVPGAAKSMAAEITGISPANIKVHMTRAGGGFGRRLMADYAYEAIILSKTLRKPVQVVWTREDDIKHDFFRPAGMYKVKAGLDANNKLFAWHLMASTTSRYSFARSMNPPYMTEVFPDGFPAGFVPNFRMQYLPVETRVPRGAWRAPGHNATAWVDQCFIDEMAALAGKDPVDFRLELLGDKDQMMPYRDHGGPEYSTKRLKNVINIAAERSKWYAPAVKGLFKGFACHFMFGAYVAEVVTISLADDQTVKVENVLAVIDCGIVINKGGALNQIEGGLIDGLSAALHQAIHIEGGTAKEKNFDRYRLMRMREAPHIDVHLVDSDETPEGLGEMSLPPVAAALCNAIYKATGKRIRKLPVNINQSTDI